jgi:spore coat-associated protein N
MDALPLTRLITLAAIFAVVAVCAGSGLASPAPPHAILVDASGDLQVTNSLDGQAIFQANGLAPGESVTGTVQLSNTGALAGDLGLAQLDVQDQPGANGGRLSDAVQLDITDVTGGNSVPVFTGQLATVGSRPLGQLAAGEERTFQFTASLPDTGIPPSSTGGDNAYVGSGLTATYSWTATAEDPGTGGGVGGSGLEPAPVVKVRVITKKLLKRGVLDVMTTCDAACRVSAYAQLPKPRRARKAPRTRTRTATLTVPNKAARIRLKLSRKSKRALAKTLRTKRRVVLRVNLSVSAAGGGPAKAISRKAVVKRPKTTRSRR